MQNGLESADTRRCCPTGSGRATWKLSLLGAGAHAVSVSCCPIEIGEVEKSESIPDDPALKGKQACEAVWPLAFGSDEAQQNVEQEGGPNLPTDGVLGIAEEIADFEGVVEITNVDVGSTYETGETVSATVCFEVTGVQASGEIEVFSRSMAS